MKHERQIVDICCQVNVHINIVPLHINCRYSLKLMHLMNYLTSDKKKNF